MAFLNFTGSVLSFALGVFLFINAKSAIHEGIAALFVTCSAIFFAGGSICYRIAGFKDELINKSSHIESQPDQPLEQTTPDAKPESLAA